MICCVCVQQCTCAGTEISSERIVQNFEVQKIQKVFDTAQARISNLRVQDEDTLTVYPKRCIGMTVTGEDIRCFIDEFPINFESNVYLFSDSVLCLGGHAAHIVKKGMTLLYVACLQTFFSEFPSSSFKQLLSVSFLNADSFQTARTVSFPLHKHCILSSHP